MFKPLQIALTSFVLSLSFQSINACTRVLYTGSEDLVITGRTLDWSEDMHSNLWVFPRGMKRDSAAGDRSFNWTSKYGSLITSGYDLGTADGMNEKGLVANVLYLAESDYGKPVENKPILSISVWGQYVLDNFSTVTETVKALRQEQFQVVAPMLPNGRRAQLHLSISDPTGDSAIFEYIDGQLVIHQGKEYKVMTNSPSYDQQLALNTYWKSIGGAAFLPGTSRAADRFARASFFIEAIPTKADPSYINAVPDKSYSNQAVASVMSVIRSVGVPLGMTTPNEPNIASTIWRTVSDQKNKVYYFDSATSPNTFWVPLSDLDFKEGAPVKKLTVADGKIYSGNASADFAPTTSFAFLPAQ